MNLPNAMSAARIAAVPFIAVLPLIDSWSMRLVAFLLYLAAAITDYYDGYLARTRNLVTDLGKQLDPLADKMLLVGTFIPMLILMGAGAGALALGFEERLAPGIGPFGPQHSLPFTTWWGNVGLPWWIAAVIVGRELFMTIFRQAAARRGVIIAAIGSAKWKTGFQQVWVGAAYFWFWFASATTHFGWSGALLDNFSRFNGVVGVACMTAAFVLTLYSLASYMSRYGQVVFGKTA